MYLRRTGSSNGRISTTTSFIAGVLNALRRRFWVSQGGQEDSDCKQRHSALQRAPSIPCCSRHRHPYRAPSCRDARLRKSKTALDRDACRPADPHHCGPELLRAPNNRAPPAPRLRRYWLTQQKRRTPLRRLGAHPANIADLLPVKWKLSALSRLAETIFAQT
jgi:hypothetical protein